MVVVETRVVVVLKLTSGQSVAAYLLAMCMNLRFGERGNACCSCGSKHRKWRGD